MEIDPDDGWEEVEVVAEEDEPEEIEPDEELELVVDDQTETDLDDDYPAYYSSDEE